MINAIPYRKRCILIPSGSCSHLYIVCNEPEFYARINKEALLAVNISSIKPDIQYDNTCILNEGDHPFVKHPSFVFYAKADIFGSNRVGQYLADGTYADHPHPCGDNIFNMVLNGFLTSPFVTPKIRKFAEIFCLK